MRIEALASHRRGGTLSVELLFVFPVLLAVLLATVEYSLWLTAQQQVSLASREGARVGATGGTGDDVNRIVRLVLGDARYQQAQVDANLIDPAGVPLPVGEPVTVSVRLPASAVVPDLLAFVGISIRNQYLVSQTVMRKE